MRRVHLTVGLLGVIAFLITGQVMGHHIPKMQLLTPDVRMMYVSRHIYLLVGSACKPDPGAVSPTAVAGMAARAATDRFPADSFLRGIPAPGLYCGTDAWHCRTELEKFLRADCAICRRDDSHCGKPCPQAELTALPVVSKIEKFEYAGVAHW